jgi:hypothetical protein
MMANAATARFALTLHALIFIGFPFAGRRGNIHRAGAMRK